MISTLDKAERALVTARNTIEMFYEPSRRWRAEGVFQMIDEALAAIKEARSDA